MKILTLNYINVIIFIIILTFTCSHLADAFIQSDLKMITIEAIKINKRARYTSAMTSLN